MGHPKGWVTGRTEVMPRRTDRGKARASPSAAGESLLITCGRGLLGHLHSRGLLVGAWLWGNQNGDSWISMKAWTLWHMGWYSVLQNDLQPTCLTRLEGVHVSVEMQRCFREALTVAVSITVMSWDAFTETQSCGLHDVIVVRVPFTQKCIKKLGIEKMHVWEGSEHCTSCVRDCKQILYIVIKHRPYFLSIYRHFSTFLDSPITVEAWRLHLQEFKLTLGNVNLNCLSYNNSYSFKHMLKLKIYSMCVCGVLFLIIISYVWQWLRSGC